MYSTLLIVLCLQSGVPLDDPAMPDRLEMNDGTVLIGQILQFEDDRYIIEIDGIGQIVFHPFAQVRLVLEIGCVKTELAAPPVL